MFVIIPIAYEKDKISLLEVSGSDSGSLWGCTSAYYWNSKEILVRIVL